MLGICFLIADKGISMMRLGDEPCGSANVHQLSHSLSLARS